MATTTTNPFSDLRYLTGLTQRELAELAGVSTSYVRQLERGLVDPVSEPVVCGSCGHRKTTFSPQAQRVVQAATAAASNPKSRVKQEWLPAGGITQTALG